MDDSAEEAATDARLDEIPTHWSLLRLAHQDTVNDSGMARKALVMRYNQAIRSYVGAMVRDDHDADEVAQDVMVRLLRGDFGGADPQRGRFRDLLKVAVKNMVRNYWNRQQRRSKLNVEVENLASAAASDDPTEAAWSACWQTSVLGMTWKALEQYQQATKGNISFILLRLRSEHPDDDIPALTARLTQAVGNRYQEAAVRQQLRRARLRFAQLLIEELTRSLDSATPQRVEEELADMGLMEYVRDLLPADWRERGELREADGKG